MRVPTSAEEKAPAGRVVGLRDCSGAVGSLVLRRYRDAAVRVTGGRTVAYESEMDYR